MAEVRKYEFLRCACGCLHDLPDVGCPQCKSRVYERITAIDQRDVEPLVEAAKRLLEVADGSAEIKPTKGVSAGRLWVEARSRALIATRDALSPFLEEGEQSG